MTVRDPYTGVEKAPHPPRPFTRRWWPVLLIAAIAAAAGFAEWRNATQPHSSAPATAAVAAGNPAASAPKPPPAPQAAASGDLAATALALTKASDQLNRASELLMGIAALQIVVLAGQLYLLGRQRRASRDRRG
jgi:hypothetical protein